MLLAIAITLAGAIAAAITAVRIARARGRSPVLWPLLAVSVGAAIFVFEHFFWARPAGDAASPAGFDMQMLLPVAGMFGAVLLITYLPDRGDDA